jgi:hypothetical protein
VATQSGGEVIIQWINARRRNGDALNWQIRLNQTTGSINIIYGSCTATNSTSYTSQVGLRGSSNSDFNNRASTTNWSATTAGSSNSSTVTSKNTIMPASGLTYTWLPPKDIGPTALALYRLLLLLYQCRTGLGHHQEFRQHLVELHHFTGYRFRQRYGRSNSVTLSGTINTGTLAAGSTVNVPMSANLDMSAGGVYNFALSTSMSGDTDPGNDNASDSRTSAAPTGVTATSSVATVCAGSTVNLFSSGNSTFTESVISQNFNGTSTPAGWNKVNSSTGGTTANADWTLRSDGYTYSTTTFHSNDNSRFYMSNSDAQGSGGTTNASLTSPVFSLVGMTAASLTFYHYYRNYDGSESGNVQVSTNGSTWTTVQSYTGATGTAIAFAPATISMNAYLGQATVQVRFLYLATYDYYWALDNFDVSGTPQPGFSWTSVPPGFTSSVQNPTNVAVGVNTTYTVTVTAGGCTSTAQVAVNTVAPPNAGNNGTLTICAGSTVTAPELFAALVGTPNGGGSWSPALAGAGTYTYTVNATAPCTVNASAHVVVSEQAQPNAGNNGTLTVCAGSTVTAPQLFAALVGTPSGGGSWSPALAGAGTYTYTVIATAPCAVNATAQVVVTEQAQPNAGTNGALTICAGSTVTAPQLLAALGGTPDGGGSWSPALAAAGTYTYTVIAVAPCAVNATAQVVVSEQAEPDAGTNGALAICAGSTLTGPQLFAALSGTPEGGGNWSPALAGGGTYTYTVTAVAPCAVNATAQVVVSEQAPPHAGTNGSIIVCDGAAPFSMFTLLGGSPQTGGAWSGPSTVLGDTYAPSTMDPGTYTYTVTAIAPCTGSATANVSVSESGNALVVRINTDANASQINWEIKDAANVTVASGSPVGNNTQVDQTVCLSNANGDCYTLKLMDSFGDGITGGGWELRTTDGKIVLKDSFSGGSVSPANPTLTAGYGAGHPFCLPLGPATLQSTECGLFNNTLNNRIYANVMPGATQYEFQFLDPDAGYVRSIIKPSASMLFIDMGGSVNPLVPGVHYFVRIRTNAGGPLASAKYGPGCEMGMSATAVVHCSQLINGTLYGHSCNETRAFGSSSYSFIYATPVLGASAYTFHIYIPGEPTALDTVITRGTYTLQLKWPGTPMANGSTYNVDVKTTVNGMQSNYCLPFCSITIDNSYTGTGGQLTQVDGSFNGDVRMWPNPVADGRVNLALNGLSEARPADPARPVRHVRQEGFWPATTATVASSFSTVLELPSEVTSGVYLAHITVNGVTTAQRLSVVR